MAQSQSEQVAPDANTTEPAERWELVTQWRRAIRTVRLIASVILVLFALLVLSEALRFYDLFARIHPVGGYLYLVALSAAIFVLAGFPAWRYWRVPKAVRPPDVHLDEDRVKHYDLVKRVRFIDRYCSALRWNPELADRHEDLAEVARKASELRAKVKGARGDATAALVGEIRQFEVKTVNPLLEELDSKVDAYIRKEALSVGVGTAICMNGTLDAFIVLWRTANMVSRVSRYYYGRPGLHGSLLLMGDVASAVMLSRAADSMSDMAAEMAADAPGRLGEAFRAVPFLNIVAGPILDGTVNALMMMRVGYLAKSRCRSFEAWDKQSIQKAVAEVAKSVAGQAAGISTELMNQVGGFAKSFTNTATGAARNAWEMIWYGLFGDKADQPDNHAT